MQPVGRLKRQRVIAQQSPSPLSFSELVPRLNYARTVKPENSTKSMAALVTLIRNSQQGRVAAASSALVTFAKSPYFDPQILGIIKSYLILPFPVPKPPRHDPQTHQCHHPYNPVRNMAAIHWDLTRNPDDVIPDSLARAQLPRIIYQTIREHSCTCCGFRNTSAESETVTSALFRDFAALAFARYTEEQLDAWLPEVMSRVLGSMSAKWFHRAGGVPTLRGFRYPGTGGAFPVIVDKMPSPADLRGIAAHFRRLSDTPIGTLSAAPVKAFLEDILGWGVFSGQSMKEQATHAHLLHRAVFRIELWLTKCQQAAGDEHTPQPGGTLDRERFSILFPRFKDQWYKKQEDVLFEYHIHKK